MVEKKKEPKPKFISGTKIEVMSLVPEDLRKLLLKPGKEWKYATTVIREENALKLGSAFFAKDKDNTLTSPSWAYPEKHEILPREKIKPKFEER
jgi:hypothetical protein